MPQFGGNVLGNADRPKLPELAVGSDQADSAHRRVQRLADQFQQLLRPAWRGRSQRLIVGRLARRTLGRGSDAHGLTANLKRLINFEHETSVKR